MLQRVVRFCVFDFGSDRRVYDSRVLCNLRFVFVVVAAVGFATVIGVVVGLRLSLLPSSVHYSSLGSRFFHNVYKVLRAYCAFDYLLYADVCWDDPT